MRCIGVGEINSNESKIITVTELSCSLISLSVAFATMLDKQWLKRHTKNVVGASRKAMYPVLPKLTDEIRPEIYHGQLCVRKSGGAPEQKSI